MNKINLLPWREELRKEQNRIFAISCAVPVSLGVLVLFFFHVLIGHMVEIKKMDESFLNQELDLNKRLIKEVEGIDTKKKELLERVSIIQTLQSTRVYLVRLLDALAKYTPDDVVLSGITQVGKEVTIVGKSGSNNAISLFMRSLDRLDWVESTKLTDVREGIVSDSSGLQSSPGSTKYINLSFTLVLVEK
jgi:type IV pilus assembly protein PilN